ncbi:MAG: PSD1 and planctomycete cytochrome C domain-containing protein [Pirellulales bacterium]
MWKHWTISIGLCAVATLVVRAEDRTSQSADATKRVDFNRDIRPILSDKCFACHGPNAASREADLRLDIEALAKADRGGYAAIVPGSLEKSEVVRRINSADESERMPPAESGKQLAQQEIARLNQWVAEGAPWSLAWSYVPPQRVPVPTATNKSWSVNWIDQFLLVRLEAEGLQPSAEADKTTLIRRLYIDLVGLPPAWEEIQEFIADQRPDAYEHLVDRLLASPHYGERMATYWLDLVRYADTVGYHGDQEHYISPYRDYVINALNSNMPFDRFTREQLAGDLLPKPTIEQKEASGYNRVLQTSHEGGVQPKEYLAIYAADHVRNLSAVWMGATMGCTQCHDHKYDPYTMRDFYSMAAFFADVDEAQHLTRAFDISPTYRLPELELLTPTEESTLAALERQYTLLAQRLEKSKSNGNEAAAKALEEQLAKRKAEIDAIHTQARRTMITVAIEPRITRILPRGNWMDDSGEVVQPAVPAFLGKLEIGDRRATRLELANWLVDAKSGAGGLTARVMANRLWYLFFGRGLAAAMDDFGGQGEAPSHPELLDSLAVEFVESGWDMKHMVKLIVTSRAYRQSSVATPQMRRTDPLNLLVAHQSSYRYPAESVRDAALSISGLLVPTVGGPSIRPYQPPGYYRHLNFPLREYEHHTDARQWRRAVYMHWQRQYLHPMLKAFDAPSREECTVERARSNTAPAALVLLNDPTFVEAARAFAVRILLEGGATVQERVNFAFRQAALRDADTEEQQLLNKLVTRSGRYYQVHPEAAGQLLGIGLAQVPDNLNQVELASWTIVARVVLNLSEVTTRN